MEKIAYLKGLLDGLNIDPASNEGKVFSGILNALEELAQQNLELEDRVAELEELCDILDEDLGDVEELLLDEDDEEDDDEDSFCDYCTGDCGSFDDDEQYETICPTCGECILLDERTLEEGETVCPKCGEELEFDFDESELEALAPDDGEILIAQDDDAE